VQLGGARRVGILGVAETAIPTQSMLPSAESFFSFSYPA